MFRKIIGERVKNHSERFLQCRRECIVRIVCACVTCNTQSIPADFNQQAATEQIIY